MIEYLPPLCMIRLIFQMHLVPVPAQPAGETRWSKPLYRTREKHDRRRQSRKPVALSRQKHARREAERGLSEFCRGLWRPALCFQKCREARGLPLSDGTRAGEDASFPPSFPPSGEVGKAAQSHRGGHNRARAESDLRRA